MNEAERIAKIADLAISLGRANTTISQIRALISTYPVQIPTGVVREALQNPYARSDGALTRCDQSAEATQR